MIKIIAALTLLLFIAFVASNTHIRARMHSNATPQTRSATWERGEYGAPPSRSGCRAENLRTSWAVKGAPIGIREHKIAITATGTSYVDLVVQNPQPFPISAVALVIEYFDDQGTTIERIPIVAAAETEGEPFRVSFPFQPVSSLRGLPIEPHGSTRIMGQSDGIITAICPAKAVVTFVSIQHPDGTTETRQSSGWQLGPTPRFIPFGSAFPSDSVKLPLSLVARVEINASGHVIDVLPVRKEQADAATEIREQMKSSWRFNPAICEGKPVPAKLTVLFRLHLDATAPFPDDGQLREPVTLIDFYPDEKNAGKLEIAYGRLFSGSGVR